MKKIIAAATAASLLSLAACADADEAAETDATMGEVETAPIDAGAVDTERTVTTGEVDGDGVRIGVDGNGVRADVRDGETSVSVDADGNPSADIEID